MWRQKWQQWSKSQGLPAAAEARSLQPLQPLEGVRPCHTQGSSLHCPAQSLENVQRLVSSACGGSGTMTKDRWGEGWGCREEQGSLKLPASRTQGWATSCHRHHPTQ